MDAFHRLSQLSGTVKERALPVWKSAVLQFEPGLQWLKLRPKIVFWAGGISIALAFLVFSGATAAGAALLAWAALRQATTANDRHQEQTNADRQRRITESFSKAVEQLGSDKLEVRLGGIYSLERISKESPDDYWTVMENLTAFVRERSRRNEAERTSQDFEQRVSRRAYFLSRDWAADCPGWRAEDYWARAVELEEVGGPPATDIAAVLTVIGRRRKRSRERRGPDGWHLDLNGAILNLAQLSDTDLEGANLNDAHLKWANLLYAHLEGARLENAHLEGADLCFAHLEDAFFAGTHLEGADLRKAVGLSEATFPNGSSGDAATRLPEGVVRPAGWPDADVAGPEGGAG